MVVPHSSSLPSVAALLPSAARIFPILCCCCLLPSAVVPLRLKFFFLIFYYSNAYFIQIFFVLY
jgi:hypothetical protein